MRPVDRDALAHRAAEQLVHRHAERLALDVQQRVLDRGDGARIDPARRLHLAHPQHRGDLLHRPRIQPDQRVGQAADHAGQAAAAIGLGVFRPADQPVIGGELEERKRAPAGVAVQVLDLREFHDVAPLCARRRHQADAAQMTEQFLQPVAVRLRQRRPQDRFDVRAQMRLIAGAEQHHIDAGLMPHVAIGRVGQAGGAAGMDQEAERIGVVGERLRHLALPPPVPASPPRRGRCGRRCCAPRTSAACRRGVAVSPGTPPRGCSGSSDGTPPSPRPTCRRAPRAAASGVRDRSATSR